MITDHAPTETPALVHTRAVSLVEYLLAVRALIDKPSRTVPAADAFWQRDLPQHPGCGVGPTRPGGSWLRVGRPAPPRAPVIAAPLVPYLVWDLSWTAVPSVPEDAPEDVRAVFGQWYEQDWLPWSQHAAAAEATRRLHDRLYDLRYRLDIDAARIELVWGHAVLDARVGDEKTHYPLLATRVGIEYDPDATVVRVVPTGPPRLQADALSGLDDRRLADLLDMGVRAARWTSTRGSRPSAATSPPRRCAGSASTR